MRLEYGWHHAQKRWSWESEDFEKTSVGYSTFEEECCVFRIWSDQIMFFGSLPREIFNIMRYAARWGWSQERPLRIVSLSSCSHGPKPEVIRPVRIRNERVWPASVYIFTNTSTRAGYDTRSIFKRSLTGLNSEFSFSCICISIYIVIIDIT